MNQFDLCSIDNIDKVYGVLEVLGFDINKAVHIYPANHRDMQNKVGVAYIFAGEYNFHREHINGPYSTIHDILGAAEARDRSLFEELYAMGHRCNDYGAVSGTDKNECVRENDEYAEEARKIGLEIQQLEDLLLHIRGSQFKSDGAIKTLEDYKNPQPDGPKRLRRKSIKKQQTQGV